jgi:alpha-D-ribose 1-methylphosphonate 5-triphosphate synthase subunit PhnI
VLGPTFDYTHRLLDFGLSGGACDMPATRSEPPPGVEPGAFTGHCPKVMSFLEKEGLLPPEEHTDLTPGDLTRQPLEFPAGRDVRLQNLARADEGLLLALAYSTQRGFGSTHPFAGEIRMGEAEIFFTPGELGFPVLVGEITLTECESVNRFIGGNGRPACFTRGYGLTFGENERKAVSMALVDRALRASEFNEEERGPAQNAEFVLYHSDNVEASGFVQHLKLPHYVDFQTELALVRSLRKPAGKQENNAQRSK